MWDPKTAVARLRTPWVAGAVVPVLAAAEFLRQRHRGLEPLSDGRVMLGIASNLRHHFSLTSPVDQAWIAGSPAETFRLLPRLPVPDVAPLYPTLVAAVPAPLETAAWIINFASLIAALVGVFVIGRRLAGPVAGVAAQAFLVAGPGQHTIFQSHRILSVAAAQTYDVTALALLLWALICWRRRTLFPLLLAAACLTRYAYTAVPVALLVVLLVRWAWTRRRPALLAPVAVATGVALFWQYLAAPFISGATAPKPIEWHRASAKPLLTALTGWAGLDEVMSSWPSVIVVAAIVIVAGAAGVALWRCRDRPLAALTAIAAAASLAMVLAGQAFLVADLMLNDERHLLPVRTLTVILLCAAVVTAVEHAAPRVRWLPVAAAIAAAGLLAVGVASDPRLADAFDPQVDPALITEVAARYTDGVIVSPNAPFVWWLTGLPALDAFRTIDSNTGRPRDTREELAELATEVNVVVSVRFPDLFSSIPVIPADQTCAVLIEPETVGAAMVAAWDITGCRWSDSG